MSCLASKILVYVNPFEPDAIEFIKLRLMITSSAGNHLNADDALHLY